MLLSLLLATSPWSAEHPAAMSARPNQPVAMVTGQIDGDFSDRLARLLDANPQVRAVEIESLGGLSTQAYQAAQALNQRSVAVRVRGRCASACAYLWASADSRALVDGARIGLHAPRPAKEPPRLLRSLVKRRNSRLEYEALSGAGFPDNLIAKARSTPPESMLWLTPEELREAGVEFQVAPSRWLPTTGLAPNNAFKPKLHRYASHMAERACHVSGYALQFGLT